MSLDRDTLLPCPFCGGAARIAKGGHAPDVVECVDCGVCVDPDWWNRRTLAQQAGAWDETGWVITRDLGARGLGYHTGSHKFEPDNLKAIRYCRESDAKTMLNYIHGGMIPETDRVEEHRWCAPPNTAAGRTCNLCNGTGYVQEADRDEPEPCGNCIDGIPDESDPDADTGERCQPAVPIAAPLTLPDVTYVIHADQPGYAGKQPFVPITDWRRMCAVAQQAIERMERAERESWQRLEDHNSQQRVAIKMQERAEAAEAQVAALTPALDDFRDTILNQRGALAENGMSNDQVNDVLSEFDDILATARGGKEK